jgi:phosphatidylglycerol:prolipoprotein diacylglycerol transferase
LYLSIGNIIIFFILNSIKPKFDGEIFGIYLILHTLLRFTIEYIRGDATQIFLGLTVSQMISVILGVIGIVLLITKWQNYKHSHKEIPVSTK